MKMYILTQGYLYIRVYSLMYTEIAMLHKERLTGNMYICTQKYLHKSEHMLFYDRVEDTTNVPCPTTNVPSTAR